MVKFDPFLSLDCTPAPPTQHNPRKERDQILPSGNLVRRSIKKLNGKDKEEGEFVSINDVLQSKGAIANQGTLHI